MAWESAEDVQVTVENHLGNELQKPSRQTVLTRSIKSCNKGTAIVANTKAIELKANQSTVDTLTRKIVTAEGSITAQVAVEG